MAARLTPIYTTSGNLGGFLQPPYIFNPQGEWIGWVTADKRVYSVHGQYVGWLNNDLRILSKRMHEFNSPRQTPPPPPGRLVPPASVPLPPMMSELAIGVIDVLDENPELMPTLDAYAETDE